MSVPKYIQVKTGNDTVQYKTEAETIGDLFNRGFRQDFNFSERGQPTVNGVVVEHSTPITPDMIVGCVQGASSKS